MLNQVTSSIATCTILGCIATFFNPLYQAERVIAQTTAAQDEISKLRSEVSKQGISPEQVNQAMRDRFPNSSFPYYEPVNGCSNPVDVDLDKWTIGKWNKLFKTACDNHDICYITPGERQDYCDQKMFVEMMNICEIISRTEPECGTMAKRYHTGVNLLGRVPYNVAQNRQRDYIRSVYDWLPRSVAGQCYLLASRKDLYYFSGWVTEWHSCCDLKGNKSRWTRINGQVIEQYGSCAFWGVKRN